VIGDNETGFRGTNDAPYRMEAWDFIFAGGGLFNNLDYSFVAGREDGTFVYPASQPGGGTPTLRRQIHYLHDFICRQAFLHLEPRTDLVKGGLPSGATARALVLPDEDYLVYVRTPAEKTEQGECRHHRFAEDELVLEVTLPAGQFEAEWFDTHKGSTKPLGRFHHPGGGRQFHASAFEDDLALAIRKLQVE
jgi:hypothetical protein